MQRGVKNRQYKQVDGTYSTSMTSLSDTTDKPVASGDGVFGVTSCEWFCGVRQIE